MRRPMRRLRISRDAGRYTNDADMLNAELARGHVLPCDKLAWGHIFPSP